MRSWTFNFVSSDVGFLNSGQFTYQIAPETIAPETPDQPLADPVESPATEARRGDGTGVGAGPGTTTPLEPQDIANLLYMLEEEKLAGDVYQAFYKLYGTAIFDQIGNSEDNHFNALAQQARVNGLDVDSFVFDAPEAFADPDLQDMFDTLVAQGSQSLTAALEVGMLIEQTDIADLAATIDGLDGTALAEVYQNLMQGSYSHLAAFETLLA